MHLTPLPPIEQATKGPLYHTRSGWRSYKLFAQLALIDRVLIKAIVTMPAAKSRSPHFKRTAQFSLDYAPVTITQYESTRTGMRMAVVDQKGPKVNGYFALATEILDDSGAPHTLEHLVFMGSKSYKYKGFLDKLATRAYSTTNAWTATEHTAYTLDTAGWDGFAQVLPVYLEHVIVPTLTDSACYTEVHHVDGTGHDAGVVYSEMQGVQNCQEELMLLQAKRLMYPEGVGFRYETGGMMDQLRVLTADRIRAFHKEMYQPKNLCLVITGEVNHEELLQIVDDFEGTILNDVPAIDAPFKRPWTTSEPTPPFRKTIVETVHFPEEDESMGEVLVAYLGPKCNEHLQVAALSVLMSYLCGSSISLLDNVLVEKEHFCSNVYFTLDVRSDMAIWFTLSAVETDRLGEAEARLTQLLNEAATNPLDMEYMNDCIKRYRRQIKLRCENAGSFFGEAIIEDHLYGHRDGRDLRVCENLDELDVLEGWSDEQWREFLSRWFVDAHHISILGKPSEALSKKITADEKLRVKHQQEQLGEEGMKDLASRLSLAQQENDTPIPDELLSRFAVPDAESVHFIPTTTARAGRARAMGRLDNDIQSIVDADSVDVPLFLHFEHIPSNFVRFKINMCTGPVPLALKPLIPLYLMNFFTTPALIDGQRVEFEQLILDLEKVTEAYDIDAEYANPELIALSLIAEPSNYQSVIKWIKTLLFDAIHDPARLHASLTKVLADVPDEKRDGRQMASSVSIMTSYLPESSSRARNTLSKATYLKQVKKQLKANPQSVVSQFSALCKALHRPENFRIYVGADVHKLDRPTSAWTVLSEGFDSNAPLEPLDSRRALLSPAGANPGSASFIVPMGTIDSSYAKVTGKGVDSYSHPDYAALTVARAYMNAVEGPYG